MIYAYIIITCVWTFHFDSYFYYCYFSTIITSAWCSRKIWLMVFNIKMLAGKCLEGTQKKQSFNQNHSWHIVFCYRFCWFSKPVFCFNCIISNQRHSSSWNLHLIFFCMCRKRHFPVLFWVPAQYVLMTKENFLKSSKWGLGLFNSQAVLNI